MGDLASALVAKPSSAGGSGDVPAPTNTQAVTHSAGKGATAAKSNEGEALSALRLGCVLVVGAVLLLIFGSRILNDVRIG